MDTIALFIISTDAVFGWNLLQEASPLMRCNGKMFVWKNHHKFLEELPQMLELLHNFWRKRLKECHEFQKNITKTDISAKNGGKILNFVEFHNEISSSLVWITGQFLKLRWKINHRSGNSLEKRERESQFYKRHMEENICILGNYLNILLRWSPDRKNVD